MPSPNLDDATPSSPVRLGRYDVTGLLGRGGMGTVYAATDIEHGNPVALKTLTRMRPSNLLRFKAEFRQVADLSHPNLASLYELSCIEGLWFFTMERVDGSNFVAFMGDRSASAPVRGQATASANEEAPTVQASQKPLPEGWKYAGEPRQLSEVATTELRSAIAQLITAVAVLHDAGLLHLDIKPSNILIEPSGRVVLLDFGLARANEDANDEGDDFASGADEDARITGTPAWMAPEQHEGRNVGEAADWFAVGLVLYAALTGVRAFHAQNMAGLAYAKHFVKPKDPREVVDVPADLADLAMALIRSNPGERPTRTELLAFASEATPVKMPPRSTDAALVGRSRERKMLDAGFRSAMAGGHAIVTIRGGSGVGKTALLRDLLLAHRSDEALKLRGRCYERESVPYKAFDGMLDGLARDLAERPFHEVESCLPEDIEILTRVFPVLAGVSAIDHSLQTSLPLPSSLPAAEIQRRADEALRALLTNLARQRRCAIEVDDLQWADADSARALSRLLEHPVPPGLFIGLTFRAAEALENAPVLAFLDGLGDATRQRIKLDLGPLSAADAESLVRANLPTSGDDLVARIVDVSGGVPYFVEELAWLVREQIEAGDEPNVDLQGVIARRVARLAPGQRRLVETLAVANTPIPVAVAIAVSELEAVGVRRAVWSLRAHDFVRGEGLGGNDVIELRHDRLRETVLTTIDDARISTLHAELGMQLAKRQRDGHDDVAWLFDSVRHLNAAASELSGQWRERAARLNWSAGQRARRGAAFDLADSCYEAGVGFLADDAWDRDYPLALALHEGAAEAAYLCGRWHALRDHVQTVETHARTPADRLGVWETQIDADIGRNAYAAAVDAGRAALLQLGVDLPADPSQEEIGIELQATMAALAELTPGAFAQIPSARDPVPVAAMRVQSRITSAAYFARPNLLPFMACRMVRASIEHGLAPATPYALSIYGIVLNTLGMHVDAHTWGQVALAMVERFDDRSLSARTGHVVHDLVCNWIVPLDSTLADVMSVFETGKSLGDIEYAAYAAHAYVHNALYAGRELGPLLDEAIVLGDFMRGHGQVNALHVHEPFEQLLKALLGRTDDPARLDGDGFLEADSLAAAKASGSRSAMCLNRVVMGLARYHMGTPEDASEVFEQARPYLDGMPSVWHTPIFHQYSSLAILGLPEPRRSELADNVDASLAALRALSEVAPMNFAHRVALVEAERARAVGDVRGGLDHCGRAIAGAKEHRWPNDLGIALQIAARCHEALDDPEAASRCREEARAVFSRWGATAKVAQLA